LKDGGTLIDLIVRGGELTVQAHALDRCGVKEPLLDGADSTLDARRVSVMVKFISSMVI
jgi:hypothetical protein